LILLNIIPKKNVANYKAGIFDVAQVGSTPLFLILVFVVTFIVLMMSVHSSEVDGFSSTESLFSAAALVISALLISGAWAMGSRLVSHEFRFLQHLAVLSIIILIVELTDMTMAYIYFIYSPNNTLDYFAMCMYTAIAVLWIFIHLCVVSRNAMMKKFIASFFIAGVFSVLIQLQTEIEEDIDVQIINYIF